MLKKNYETGDERTSNGLSSDSDSFRVSDWILIRQVETRGPWSQRMRRRGHVEVKYVRRLITPTLVLSMVLEISCGCFDIKIEGLHWNPRDECLWIRGWYLERPVNLP